MSGTREVVVVVVAVVYGLRSVATGEQREPRRTADYARAGVAAAAAAANNAMTIGRAGSISVLSTRVVLMFVCVCECAPCAESSNYNIIL